VEGIEDEGSQKSLTAVDLVTVEVTDVEECDLVDCVTTRPCAEIT
jgi:hypothetical protein